MFGLRTVKNFVMEKSRTKKLDHFYSLYHGGAVLDVGVSGKDTLPVTNIFLKTFRYPSHFYTGLGIEDLSVISRCFPDKRFVQYEGGCFPFDDLKFEWVFCNAVIEHLGDYYSQLQFVQEMLRVGKNVFFTTPNKYFPIETHTNLFFLHWIDELFYRWSSLYKPRINPKSLRLFSYGRLEMLMKIATNNHRGYKIIRNRFLGFTMTFTVVCR